MTNTRRSTTHRLLLPGGFHDLPSLLIDVFIVGVILVDLFFIVISTVPGYERHSELFEQLEPLVLAIFALEYGLRLWSCVESETYSRPLLGRLRYALTPLAIADLLAILPIVAFVPGFGDFVPIELSAVRLFRLARLTKLTRYMASVRTLSKAIWRVRNELGAIAAMSVLLIVGSSMIMWGLERGKNPEHFGSIPEAMWWAIVTMTTVGYGDMTPVTPIGRLVASGVMIFGIAMFALPAGLLGAAFTEEVRRESQRRKLLRARRLRKADHLRTDKIEHKAPVVCPHCQKPIFHSAEEIQG